MTFFSTFAITALSLSFFAAAEGQLSYGAGTKNNIVPESRLRGLALRSSQTEEVNKTAALLSPSRGSASLAGCWGPFHQDGFCVEKIMDPEDATSDKVKFVPCDDTVAAQMWKFDKDIDDNLPNFYEHGGLLHNMEGGCLAIRGDVEVGKNLKVLACDRNNAKQHWLSDGDSLVPRDSRELCVSSVVYPIAPQDPVVLLNCEDTNSLDY